MSKSEQFRWAPTTTQWSTRHEDVWFIDPEVGWAVTNEGHIIHTDDGGAHWCVQFGLPGIRLRSVSFADAETGWVGTISPDHRLYHTTDGGKIWREVENLPPGGESPRGVCGLWAVNREVIYGTGFNVPRQNSAAVIKSIDGGKTWTGQDMRPQATNLVDIYFPTPERGWVVGGISHHEFPDWDNTRPAVLYTEDGGETWTDQLESIRHAFEPGWTAWKIQFLAGDRLGFVSLQNFEDAMILKTTDGGRNWTKIPIRNRDDKPINLTIQGVGFLDEQHGWVSGWGDLDLRDGRSSGTYDGGKTWEEADERLGTTINRFRFIGDPPVVGYAAGNYVYKYTRERFCKEEQPRDTPLRPPSRLLTALHPQAFEGSVPIAYFVPEGTERVKLEIGTPFGDTVRSLFDEKDPKPGDKSTVWNCKDDSGQLVEPGIYDYRLTADDLTECRTIRLRSV